MTATEITGGDDPQRTISAIKLEFQRLYQEALRDGDLDPEQKESFQEAARLIKMAEAKARENAQRDAETGAPGDGADAARASWEALSADFDGVKREIEDLREAQHPDLSRFESMQSEIESAARAEDWMAAIAALDRLQTALGAAGHVPEGAGEGPEADEELAKLREAAAEAAEAEDAPEEPTKEELAAEEAELDAYFQQEWERRFPEAMGLLDAQQRIEELGYEEADELAAVGNQMFREQDDGRFDEALKLLDSGIVLLRAIRRRHGEEAGPEQGERADWEAREKDYAALQEIIDRRREAEEFEEFSEILALRDELTQALAEERFADAVRFLDSALIIARTLPSVPEEDKPGAAPAPDESSGAAGAGEDGSEEETGEDDAGEDDTGEAAWRAMADQFAEFQRLMQQIVGAGHAAAGSVASIFADILEAQSEERWSDAIRLLATAMQIARNAAAETGTGGPGSGEAPHTTDPVIGGEAPEAPDGGEPGRINPASASISGSVGQGGKNKEDDVRTVQQLLNQKGAAPALEVDGLCGPKTIGAVRKFQSDNLGFADGRVDPGGQTWGALTGGAAASQQPGTGSEGDEVAAAAGGGEGGATGDRETIGGIADVQPAPEPTEPDGPAYVPPSVGLRGTESAPAMHESALAEEQTMRRLHQEVYVSPGNLIGKANALAQRDETRAAEIYGEAWNNRALGKQKYDAYPGITNPEDSRSTMNAAGHAHSVSWHYARARALFQEGDRQWGPQADDEEGRDEPGGVDQVEEAIDEARRAVEEALGDAGAAVDEAADWVDEEIEDISDEVDEIFDEAADEVDELVEEAEEMIDEFVEDVQEDIEEMVEDAEDMAEEAEEMIDDVVEFFSGDDDDEDET